MDFPNDFLYTKDHEWAHKGADDVYTIGITHHAQESLGEIVFCELPKKGRELKSHETFGVVESIKAVSDLYSPLAGTVIETNEAVVTDPALINRDAHKAGWLLKLKLTDRSALSSLMTADQYKAFVAAL